jgi:hypothetical protein
MHFNFQGLENLSLYGPHPGPLFLRTVIVSQEVQHPVGDQQLQFCLGVVAGVGGLSLSAMK